MRRAGYGSGQSMLPFRPQGIHQQLLHVAVCSTGLCVADEGGLSAGMEPGPEDFGQVERIVLDSMSSEMSVSALVSPQLG